MIRLRPITAGDIAAIKQWPHYGPGFEQMDYCLRDNGWLDEFADRPDAVTFAAEQDGQVIAFSLLNKTSAEKAEFRVALHPDRVGKGLGATVTAATLAAAFEEIGLERVFLIVRKSNPRAARLYDRIGFLRTGESVHTIQGTEIEFIDMELPRKAFRYQERRQ